MAYKIEKWCTGCRLCPSMCPTNCITPGFPHVIDAKACTSCGICANICPAGAPVNEEDQNVENLNMY